jgi:hypothetical protein
VALYVNTFFEKRVEQLFDLAGRVEAAFAAAGLEYRVIGGLAVYLYVEEAEPDAGRLTRDIDIAVRREDLDRIARAVEPFGMQYRQVDGEDMLVQAGAPSARRAVHLKPAPAIGHYRTLHGVRLVPLADLIRLKLTSFRSKDETHLKDLDEAGLITPENEAGLSEAPRARLAQVRAHE